MDMRRNGDKGFGDLRRESSSRLQRLQGRHHRMIDLKLEGVSHVDIASELGCTPQSVSLCVNAPIFQKEMARRREEYREGLDDEMVERVGDASQIIRKATILAAETQVSLLGSDNEIVQQRSAMDILDRGGFPKVTKSEDHRKNITLNLTGEDLERIQTAAVRRFGSELEINLEPSDVEGDPIG